MTYGVTRLSAWPKSSDHQDTAPAAPEPPAAAPQQAAEKPAEKPAKSKPKG